MIPRRLELARLPTPIDHLDRLSRDLGREIYLWRDDLTGFLAGGNKVRKLEYELAEAKRRGATAVVTCGGPQSNHARATVWLARRLGWRVRLVVREPPEGRPPPPPTGNLLLNEIAGAELCWLPYREFEEASCSYQPFLDQEVARLEAQGEVAYAIPEGASTALGCLGYRRAVGEMLETWRDLGTGSEAPDSLFLAVGSGGTHAGLVLGYELHGLEAGQIFGINVCDSAEFFAERVGSLLAEARRSFDLPAADSPLNLFDGHVGDGYGLASAEELGFYRRLANLEGILLDPCYTGKAFRGMLAELARDPQRFGRRILFLHSGGALATFAYANAYMLGPGQDAKPNT